MTGLRLTTVPGLLSICRLEPDHPVPDWATGSAPFTSLTRTAAELSIVCPASAVPATIAAEGPFRALAVEGPLDFGLTGILAALATALAAAGLSIFAVSTYDTDYILVAADRLADARAALRAAGHRAS